MIGDSAFIHGPGLTRRREQMGPLDCVAAPCAARLALPGFLLDRIEMGVTDQGQNRGDLARAAGTSFDPSGPSGAGTGQTLTPGEGHAGVGVTVGIEGELSDLEGLGAHPTPSMAAPARRSSSRMGCA